MVFLIIQVKYLAGGTYSRTYGDGHGWLIGVISCNHWQSPSSVLSANGEPCTRNSKSSSTSSIYQVQVPSLLHVESRCGVYGLVRHTEPARTADGTVSVCFISCIALWWAV